MKENNKIVWSRDSSVGIATRYGLDGPVIESRWGGENFRTRPDRLWSPPSLLYKGYQVFPGVMRSNRGVDHSPHLTSRLKKEKSYISFSPCTFVACFRLKLTFNSAVLRQSYEI
jgi:hypothetical protein